MGCLICERIEQIQKGCNPYFVCELETGYVVLGDHQRFAGYTLFLCKQHETELHLLPWDYRMKFLQEMSLVAEAVYQVYQPEKMNYELLGNGDIHLHWHLFPRVIPRKKDRSGGCQGKRCGMMPTGRHRINWKNRPNGSKCKSRRCTKAVWDLV